VDPETSEWLDGPGLVAWLNEQRLLYVDEDEAASKRGGAAGNGYFTGYDAAHASFMRRTRDWQSGGIASVYTVDKFLIHHGRHLSELPDDLYIASCRVAA
jgi:hypothetical protein